MDKQFVLQLSPSIIECLPHGAITQIAFNTKLDAQSVRKIILGEWTNVLVTAAAIKVIKDQRNKLNAFLMQLPPEPEE